MSALDFFRNRIEAGEVHGDEGRAMPGMSFLFGLCDPGPSGFSFLHFFKLRFGDVIAIQIHRFDSFLRDEFQHALFCDAQLLRCLGGVKVYLPVDLDFFSHPIFVLRDINY
jgi:hypothetical protein